MNLTVSHPMAALAAAIVSTPLFAIVPCDSGVPDVARAAHARHTGTVPATGRGVVQRDGAVSDEHWQTIELPTPQPNAAAKLARHVKIRT
ncbi:hypothetical protein IHE31_01080 (plasmid) [Mycetohabitans rhizoxinica]|uniref:hypothetical protein n=1 Tax=Mycetohabitans rhizoxinica TaxID=412963 RepID=UPI0030D07D68